MGGKESYNLGLFLSQQNTPTHTHTHIAAGRHKLAGLNK